MGTEVTSRKIFQTAVLCVPILFCIGCASVVAHVGIHQSFPAEGAYPGVRIESQTIAELAHEGGGDIGLAAFMCLDFPLTLALDTLLLPIDLARSPGGKSN